jgi:exonuclease III
LNRLTRRYYVLLCGLLLSGCASVHVGKEDTCRVPAEPSKLAAPADDVLRLISWNVHGTHQVAPMEQRIGRISNEVLTRMPDVALFQEIWFEGDALLLERALSDRYKRIRDAEEVHSHFLSPFVGFRKGGLLAFVAKASPWKEKGGSNFEQFKDSASWFRFKEGDGISSKGTQYFSIENAGHEIVILNTHLQSQYPEYGEDRRYTEIRLRQIGQLRKRAESFDGRMAVLVSGDFNTLPYDPKAADERKVYEALTASWSDLTRYYRETCQCGTHLEPDAKDKALVREAGWIDYVLLRTPAAQSKTMRLAKLELIKSTTIDCPYSDHHGLDVLVPVGDR